MIDDGIFYSPKSHQITYWQTTSVTFKDIFCSRKTPFWCHVPVWQWQATFYNCKQLRIFWTSIIICQRSNFVAIFVNWQLAWLLHDCRRISDPAFLHIAPVWITWGLCTFWHRCCFASSFSPFSWNLLRLATNPLEADCVANVFHILIKTYTEVFLELAPKNTADE